MYFTFFIGTFSQNIDSPTNPVRFSILLAGFTYWSTKSKEREAELRKEKLEYYKKFIESINETIEGDKTPDGNLKFAKASNNLMLMAPQSVIEALNQFRDEISISNSAHSTLENHDRLLSTLMYEIRKDLKISPKDKKDQLRIKLWASGASK
ncbi:MAG TPA: hypothetical protein PLU69_07550 [Acinetobacter sp.]|nr:hypothetical protein [Acinetobacter sp.]